MESANFLDRMVRLGKAANLVGVDSRTLRRWLEQEQGLALPRRGRGAWPLVKMADLQAVIANHSAVEKQGLRATP
jgi:hypothetical protein